MPIPNPEPGLVISYAYLWHHEHQAGREEGQKDRPSVIVLAVEREANDATIVRNRPFAGTGQARRRFVGKRRMSVALRRQKRRFDPHQSHRAPNSSRGQAAFAVAQQH